MLAQEGAAAINPFDDTFSTAEGALWNAQLAWTKDRPQWGSGNIEGLEDHFSSHKGSGDGVHNPFLIEALLTASIEAVERRYNLPAGKVVSLSNQMQLPPGVSRH